MDSGQLAASTQMCCQQTTKTFRAVVQLHRRADPPRAHLWAPLLCEQNGCSAGGIPTKRSTNLATAEHGEDDICAAA